MNDSAEDRSEARLLALLEAAIFVSPDPIPLPRLAYALGETPEHTASLLEILAAEFAKPQHGLMLRRLAHGYQLITKPEHHEGLRNLVQNLPPPAPLSQAAVETAAIIAYKQPVTAAELQAIRGVRNTEALRTLLKRGIIAPAGRALTRGHPMQYKTTRRFLITFGLDSLAELPSREELRQQQRFPLGVEW
jgi:segregation and condensation protein B